MPVCFASSWNFPLRCKCMYAAIPSTLICSLFFRFMSLCPSAHIEPPPSLSRVRFVRVNITFRTARHSFLFLPPGGASHRGLMTVALGTAPGNSSSPPWHSRGLSFPTGTVSPSIPALPNPQRQIFLGVLFHPGLRTDEFLGSFSRNECSWRRKWTKMGSPGTGVRA